MSDIDLSGFSAQSFERFAQALSVQILGPGTIIFGDGPDGAREATFEGKVPYPSAADRWDGYVVVQAKFLGHPRDTAADANWLAAQLRSELEKFADEDRALRRPEFYILVTNVRLSPAPETKRGKGGLAKIDAVFKEFRGLGIRAYSVWHHDQIRTFLDGDARALRLSFAAWITSSDVLAKMLAQVEANTPDFNGIMTRFVQRELRSQRPTRLQQAGHVGDDPINLEEVFTDLPFIERGWEDRSDTAEMLLQSLMRRAREKLDPSSVAQAGATRTGTRPDRYLVMGGPGQGKSTISQFMAQAFRVRVLEGSSIPLTADVESISPAITSGASRAGLSMDVPRRFPLRIDLPIFADAISKAQKEKRPLSLIAHIANHIGDVAQSIIDVEDLRKWLQVYPWVLLLDGLDEVPPSGGRSDVIRSINEFWDDATGASADLMMIVMTRPQGYNDDLDPKLYTKLEMTKLNPAQAMTYAERLAAVKMLDSALRERVLARLRVASSQATTAHLLISPLQVAILLALIDQRGDAPNDRWTLFHEYFGVVLKREQEKFGPAGETIKKWARLITSILQQAGFLLHADAELRGGADAFLTRDEFELLIDAHLQTDEFDPEASPGLRDELVTASAQRLVLLVQREDGRFAFEVRSLQEYMAAAYLMGGQEVAVQSRLRNISNKIHWRHVYQIAASKCFSATDAEQYRDTIINNCEHLNIPDESDLNDSIAFSGSLLSLALLEDGLAYDQPKYRRQLWDCAFGVLWAGAAETPQNLIDIALIESERLYFPALEQRLSHSNARVRQAAWRVLFALAEQHAWAQKAVDLHWRSAPGDHLSALLSGHVPTSGGHLHAFFAEQFAKFSPQEIDSCMSWCLGDDDRVADRYAAAFPFLQILRSKSERDQQFKILPDSAKSILLTGHSLLLRDYEKRMQIYDNLPETDSWAAWRAVAAFHRAPSADALQALANVARAQDWLSELRLRMGAVPWPLASWVSMLEDVAAVTERQFQSIDVDIGGLEDWRSAENRWLESGISDGDLAVWQTGKFFDGGVAICGAPEMYSFTITHRVDDSQLLVDRLLTISNNIPISSPRQTLLRMLTFVLSLYQPSVKLDADQAIETFFRAEEDQSQNTIYVNIFRAISDPLNSEALLGAISKAAMDGAVYARDDDHGFEDAEYFQAAIAHPEFGGLIIVALAACGGGAERFKAMVTALVPLARALLKHSDSAVRDAAAAIVLGDAGTPDSEYPELVKVLLEKPGRKFGLHVALERLPESLPPQKFARWLSVLVPELAGSDNPYYYQAMGALRRFLDTRQSGFSDKARWAELKLGERLYDVMEQRLVKAREAA